jgi:RimJ/RimL family protein N-acetyltransferase
VTESGFDPPANTARIRLREFTRADVEEILALDSDPEVIRFVRNGIPSTRTDAEAAIERVLKRYHEHPGQGSWHATRIDDGRFIGWGSLKYAGESQHVEVGYRLMRAAWGMGFATELARAMVARGFDVLGLTRIIGVTHPDNVASQHVLLKAGMSDEGWGRYYDQDLRLFAIQRLAR